MSRHLRALRHYGQSFAAILREQGLGAALRRTGTFAGNRLLRPVLRRLSPALSRPPRKPAAFEAVVAALPVVVTRRPLLMILSDIGIRQCVHYRINQKMRFLREAGIAATHVQPGDVGRIRAFLPLAHTVIVYRTALDAALIDEIRAAGVRLVFEFDDLVVGAGPLARAGILDQVTPAQGANLSRQADRFLQTAAATDRLIVSTPFLADLYASPEGGLAGRPVHVIPNFIEKEDYHPPIPPEVTFAYTTPSGSIRSELAMLLAALRDFDAQADAPWSIVTIGNPTALAALQEAGFRHGQVLAQPFADYADYLNLIARAGAVLIPLSDSAFNRSKTPIRLMDAALAGTQAVFCPVGTYAELRDSPGIGALAIPGADWPQAGAALRAALAARAANVAALQVAVHDRYGRGAAQACYRRVFLDEIGMAADIDPAARHATAAGADA